MESRRKLVRWQEREKTKEKEKRGRGQSVRFGKRYGNFFASEFDFSANRIFVENEKCREGKGHRKRKDRERKYLKRIVGKPMGAVSVITCRISLSQPSNTLKEEIGIGKKERKETRKPGPQETLKKREERKP